MRQRLGLPGFRLGSTGKWFVCREIAFPIRDVVPVRLTRVRIDINLSARRKNDCVESARRQIDPHCRGRIIDALTDISFQFRKFCGKLRLHDRGFLNPKTPKAAGGQRNLQFRAGDFHRSARHEWRRGEQVDQRGFVQLQGAIDLRNDVAARR